MELVFVITTILAPVAMLVAAVAYYRSKAKEFESLFELSKLYNHYFGDTLTVSPKLNKDGYTKEFMESPTGTKLKEVRFNKDGSIAKKRGRKPKV